MLLGIPRGFFYYEYIKFIRMLFHDTDVELLTGDENDENTLKLGNSLTVDEACFPIKLLVGQTERLCAKSDRVLIPRVMKDHNGRWLCPKLLGFPEFVGGVTAQEKLLIMEPLYFNDERKLKKALWNLCRELNIERSKFQRNFINAYKYQQSIASGQQNLHIEASWEFVPRQPKKGEIILPNIGKVLVIGHLYNVYDKFANGNIMEKLDELGIESLTERQVSQIEKENAVAAIDLVKRPFWEALIRCLGTALCLRQEVEGIVYLSSFSCGPDAVILELVKTYVPELPILVLKLDEHRGEAGIETRLEAFADLLEKRRVS